MSCSLFYAHRPLGAGLGKTFNMRMASVQTKLVPLYLLGCLLLLAPTVTGVETDESGSDEEQLMYKLENMTHPLVRPVKYVNQTVWLRTYLVIRDFNLDDKTGTFEVYASTYRSWKDYNIRWRSKEYSKIRYISIPNSEIWRPTIELLNRKEPAITHSKGTWIHKAGYVWDSDRVRFVVPCHLDLTYFPFDTQTCVLNFTSTLYNNKEVSFRPYGYIWSWWMQSRIHNQWNLVKSRLARITVDAHNPKEKGTGAKSTIGMATFVLSRKPAYFVYVYITPVVLVSLLTLVVFVLPPGDPQKSTLGGSLLICYSIFFVEVNVIMPAYHANVPILNQYYMAMYALLASSIVFSTITTNLTQRSEGVWAPPEAFKQFVIEYVGKCVCLPYNPTEYRRKIEAGIANINLDTTTTTTSATTGTTSAGTTTKEQPEVISDWLHMAAIFDRLLLGCYLVLTVVITTAMLKNRPAP